jgi:hypothetical protein
VASNTRPPSQAPKSQGIAQGRLGLLDDIGPVMLARIAKHTGLRPEDL